jgi:hypothetical protein
MTIPTIGTKGAQLDLLIRQGSTLGPNSTTLKDGAGAAIDITGALLRGQIRKTPDAVAVSAAATCAIVSGPGGIFTWKFEAVDTTALTCSVTDENQAESLYVWDLEIEYTDGRIQPLLYGDVRVFREVTKV